jgi:hypothetical protein
LQTYRAPIAVLIVLAVFAGCTSSTSAPPPSPSVSTSSTSAIPTLSAGQQAANEVVVKYRALIDQLRQQYKPDLTPLIEVSSDAAYEKWRYTLQDDFVNGQHQTGTSLVSILSTESGTTADEWIVSACVDFSNVDIVDKAGRSVMPTPGGRLRVAYTVDQVPTNLHWYVTREEVGSTC